MSHNLTLYWGSGSPFAWRVMILLLESGLQFNSKLLSFSNREHKSEEFLKINPLGKVPALTDGDVKVHESLAIIHYLQITYPNETAKLFGGSNGKDRADALIKYHEFNSYLAQQGSDVGSHLWRKTGELAHVYKQFQALITELKRWDGFLANATYFAGENFTGMTILTTFTNKTSRRLHRNSTLVRSRTPRSQIQRSWS